MHLSRKKIAFSRSPSDSSAEHVCLEITLLAPSSTLWPRQRGEIRLGIYFSFLSDSTERGTPVYMSEIEEEGEKGSGLGERKCIFIYIFLIFSPLVGVCDMRVLAHTAAAITAQSGLGSASRQHRQPLTHAAVHSRLSIRLCVCVCVCLKERDSVYVCISVSNAVQSYLCVGVCVCSIVSNCMCFCSVVLSFVCMCKYVCMCVCVCVFV